MNMSSFSFRYGSRWQSLLALTRGARRRRSKLAFASANQPNLRPSFVLAQPPRVPPADTSTLTGNRRRALQPSARFNFDSRTSSITPCSHTTIEATFSRRLNVKRCQKIQSGREAPEARVPREGRRDLCYPDAGHATPLIEFHRAFFSPMIRSRLTPRCGVHDATRLRSDWLYIVHSS